MNITTRGQYGLKALFELSLRHGSGPVPLHQIAEAQGLPEHYLEQLMGPLRKAELVRSIRGAQGGYLLGRNPEEITVGEILRVLEGPLVPVECALDEPAAYEYCEAGANCTIRQVWVKVRDAVTQVVDGITLADLRAEELARLGHTRLSYQI